MNHLIINVTELSISASGGSGFIVTFSTEVLLLEGAHFTTVDGSAITVDFTTQSIIDLYQQIGETCQAAVEAAYSAPTGSAAPCHYAFMGRSIGPSFVIQPQHYVVLGPPFGA